MESQGDDSFWDLSPCVSDYPAKVVIVTSVPI